jgi:hypothetical protein
MNYVPTASQRKEKRTMQSCELHNVEHTNINEETWQELIGKKIFFWSWTLTKIDETTTSRYFIFHTISDLGFYKIQRIIARAYPIWEVQRWSPFHYGKNMRLPIPYILSHAIEIKTPETMSWLELMRKVTILLEKELRR